MRKVFCDACGKELKSVNDIYKYEYYVHISDNALGYRDEEGNRISRKVCSEEVCAHCYNKIMTSSYIVFKEIQKEKVVL